ncbi:MAG TPA: 2,3-bisphosphoglycerate-independent phosphoglycerate mutase [Thermovirgaceae bacterium]|nr:2,3-bisphosphoglycerate-independent phosphoglycerate mutase [Thermovirgaceae bacterium]
MKGRLEMLRELAVRSDTKMVLLVMDGLGGLPSVEGLTELESAFTPNLDMAALRGETGLLEIVDTGITPGSGPGHLSLFGYDPRDHFIGRGILEAMGTGAEVLPGEICARGNYSTWGEGDLILDRRAGRIDTESSSSITSLLGRSIREIDGVSVRFYPGLEHRFSVVLSGEELGEKVTDADPQIEGKPMVWAEPLDDSGRKTATVINSLIRKVREVLSGNEKANGCLLRGISGTPDIPLIPDLYGIRAAALATYPMYRGLARIVGMDVVDAGKTVESLFQSLRKNWDSFDFFFVHVKYTDSRGEDGDFEAKKEVIEKVDTLLPDLLSLDPDVLAVTGDHSTPAMMGGHSWHPSPLLVCSRFVRPDTTSQFGERSCSLGSLGLMPGSKLMGLMLAHAGRLAKYGA